MASPAIPPPAPRPHDPIVAVRVPVHLRQQLAALATRDANNISAVVRRLLSIGLRAETGAGPARPGRAR